MSTPLSREDVERIVGEAVRGGAKPRLVRVTSTIKTPGPVQYAMRHLSFTVEEELPAGKKRSEAIKEICDDLAPLVIELEPKTGSARQSAAPAAKPNSTPRPVDLTKILSPEQLDLVESKMAGNVLIVKAKGWLGEDAWNSLHDRMYAAGFRWISAGKESHWEIRA